MLKILEFAAFMLLWLMLCAVYILIKFFPLDAKKFLKEINEKPVKILVTGGNLNWWYFRGPFFKTRFYSKGLLISFLNQAVYSDYKDVSIEENTISTDIVFINNKKKYKIPISKTEAALIKELSKKIDV